MKTTPTVKATEKEGYLFLEICKNGEPVSSSNPVIEMEELQEISFDIIPSGVEIAIISGMPMTFVGAAIAHYSNKVQALAVLNPKLGGALIIKSTSPKHKIGQFVPV